MEADIAGRCFQGDRQRSLAEPAAQGRLRSARHAAHGALPWCSFQDARSLPDCDAGPGARDLLALQEQAPEKVEAAVLALYRAYFVDGKDISSPVATAEVLSGIGVDGAALQAALNDPAIKERLRRRPSRPSSAASSAPHSCSWTGSRSGGPIDSSRSSAGAARAGSEPGTRREAREMMKDRPASRPLERICIFCGSSPGADPVYRDAARAVGRRLRRARNHPRLRWRRRRNDGRGGRGCPCGRRKSDRGHPGRG